MRGRTTAFATAAMACAAIGCTHAEGSFHAEGPKLGTWSLVPDTCTSTAPRGLYGVDLFRNDEREDTELVITGAGLVLARVPGGDRMVVFTKEDCRVLDIDLRRIVTSRGKRMGVRVTGSVRLLCERTRVGKIEGSATFSCL